ncbi:HD-GYP domain-containing protein [Streptomyces sp. CRN 30]|uniref:HD-GYP domain-containing protein n=1 Tax=Streptomyces sp. CRN 30 TaxID=3075613 RepID=UPI002A7F61BD|nr:HD domain-containing protein [Streptomyces sp. CRN 30]
MRHPSGVPAHCSVDGLTPVVLVRGATVLLTVTALVHTVGHGFDGGAAALAFGLLVAVGELSRWTGAGTREPAPLAAAGALAYALLGQDAGEPTRHGVLQVVAVVTVAALAGCLPRAARERGAVVDRLVRRVLTVACAALCFRLLPGPDAYPGWHGPAYVPLLIAALGPAALCDALLAATLTRARTGWPLGPLLRDALRALPCIGSAVCATGVAMSLAVAVAGLWALPVFCLPLLLAQLSFRRHAAVRTTYRQTIASLARATDIAGYTPPGHARRVAALSRAVGRELGLTESELTVLEYAALMHDIGQLSLVDPVPAGATAGLPAAQARRIALLGGAVVRQTGVDAEVAVVVERQADPYREQPVGARIVRTVNAYEERTRDAGPDAPPRAIEELRRRTARDHQPEVVESLARVLARGGGGVRGCPG